MSAPSYPAYDQHKIDRSDLGIDSLDVCALRLRWPGRTPVPVFRWTALSAPGEGRLPNNYRFPNELPDYHPASRGPDLRRHAEKLRRRAEELDEG